MDMLPPTRIVSNLSCVQQKLNSSDQFILNANSWELPSEAVVQTRSVKKNVLKNFTKFTRKHLCWGLFLIKCRPEALSKKRSWQRCFPVNFSKFLRTPFIQNKFGGCFCVLPLHHHPAQPP